MQWIMQWTLALLLSVAAIDAAVEEKHMMMEGVPIYNFGLARLARAGHPPHDHLALSQMMAQRGEAHHPQDDDDIDWILVLKDDESDKQVDDICHDPAAKACLSEGHPDGHGLAVTGIRATVGGLRKVLKNHTGEIRQVEPNLPIFVPPSEVDMDVEALLQSLQPVEYFFVMMHVFEGLVKGEQYKTMDAALERFNVLKKEGSPVMIVNDNFDELKFEGKYSDAIVADFAKWWSAHTGKQPGNRPKTTTTLMPTSPPKPTGKPKPTPISTPGNVRRRRSSPNNTPTPWGLDRIDDEKGLDKSYEFAYDGHGVHVYVLDTGIKYDHTDFLVGNTYKSRAIPTLEMWDSQPVECAGDADPTCAVDRFGHGTHCAGTVAGEKSGVAKGATIHAVKVLGDDGKGSDLGVAMAVDWIMRKGKRPAVLSMSLGRRGKSATMATTLKKATDAGLTVVVAAGNEDMDACGNSPAFVPEVITVGATTQEDSRADFSNYGECLDIFAPGKSITSAYYAGAARFATMSGTSMACPHVAGFAALLLQANPNLKPQEVKQLMKKEGIKDKMLGSGPRSPDLMLYVNPKPSWGKGTNSPRDPIPAPVRPARRRSARRRRRRSGPAGPTRRRSGSRRRRRRRKPTPTPTPA